MTEFRGGVWFSCGGGSSQRRVFYWSSAWVGGVNGCVTARVGGLYV